MSRVFATRLKEARTVLGLSQRELAVRVGVREEAIFLYERGTQSPKLESLVALAQELDCSTDFLCGLEN